MKTQELNVQGSTSKPVLDRSEILSIFSAFSTQNHLLLAVSGGPDSIAMMQLACAVGDLKLSSVTVNHGLRAEALSEAKHVSALAVQLNIPHAILEWQGEKPKTRVQELARVARYELLFVHARAIGATHVLTAHTLDDQAETILFRMARGSGITGLIGMRDHVQRGSIIHSRPFLGIPKERLVATCIAHKLAYIEDVSNLDRKFARVRIRKVMPLLAEEGLTAHRFLELSKRAKRADDALEARVQTLWNNDYVTKNIYDLSHIIDESAEIILRYLLKLIKHAYLDGNSNFDFKHLRLNTVENILDDFHSCLKKGKTWKRSLAGLVMKLGKDRQLCIVSDPRSVKKFPKIV